jgi:hypothetical protein
MNWFDMLLISEWNPESSVARQPRAAQHSAMPDRYGSTPGVPDLVPPLVSGIATLFWCQPTVRPADGRQ